jgi:hypothetical protein
VFKLDVTCRRQGDRIINDKGRTKRREQGLALQVAVLQTSMHAEMICASDPVYIQRVTHSCRQSILLLQQRRSLLALVPSRHRCHSSCCLLPAVLSSSLQWLPQGSELPEETSCRCEEEGGGGVVVLLGLAHVVTRDTLAAQAQASQSVTIPGLLSGNNYDSSSCCWPAHYHSCKPLITLTPTSRPGARPFLLRHVVLLLLRLQVCARAGAHVPSRRRVIGTSPSQ